MMMGLSPEPIRWNKISCLKGKLSRRWDSHPIQFNSFLHCVKPLDTFLSSYGCVKQLCKTHMMKTSFIPKNGHVVDVLMKAHERLVFFLSIYWWWQLLSLKMRPSCKLGKFNWRKEYDRQCGVFYIHSSHSANGLKSAETLPVIMI